MTSHFIIGKLTMSTIVITGAGSGIGRAIAIKMANLDHQVFAVGRRLEPLEMLKKVAPKNIHIITADVAQEAGRKKIVSTISFATKPFYLIHNAGIADPIAQLPDISLEKWRYQMAVNVEAPLFLTQALLPYLAGGRVLHLSSGLAHHPHVGVATYCMSKAALYMLYQCWREEIKNQNIAFGSLNPGPVDTEMQVFIRGSTPQALPSVENFIAMKTKGQLVSPTIIADFVAWLLFAIDAEKFSAQEWDVRDPSHHRYWLKDKNIEWGRV